MSFTVFITGAGGFVGTEVARELIRRRCHVRGLFRSGPDRSAGLSIEPIVGDIGDVGRLTDGIKGCDAVIHLVGIIAEKPREGVTFERIHVRGTRSVVEAARSAGVTRFVHMSALGTRADAQSDYHKTKWQAEEAVRTSGLQWTILRPSMIHGPRGQFMRLASAWARKSAMPYVAMPYFGRGLLGLGGAGRLQPVFVGDVARAFADALDRPQTIGKTYALGGPDRYTWPAFYQAVALAIVGRNRATLPIPAWYAKALSAIAPRSLLPFNRDQVIMSQEDNVADLSPFVADFGWTPRSLEPLLSEYADELRKSDG